MKWQKKIPRLIGLYSDQIITSLKTFAELQVDRCWGEYAQNPAHCPLPLHRPLLVIKCIWYNMCFLSPLNCIQQPIKVWWWTNYRNAFWNRLVYLHERPNVEHGRQRVWTCSVGQYLIEFLKWSSAGFFTVQLLSTQRSASDGSSTEREREFIFTHPPQKQELMKNTHKVKKDSLKSKSTEWHSCSVVSELPQVNQ